MELPFGRTRKLEAQIDDFLDTIVKAVLELRECVRAYLDAKNDEFLVRVKTVAALEREADNLRREAKTMLYVHSLIPESRGDVLGLLENLDDVVNDCKAVLAQFEVQQPRVPEEFVEAFAELTDKSVQAVDQVVMATRAFMRQPAAIRDHVNKVDFYESEADEAGLKLKKRIFRSDWELAHKLHLRYFAELIESLSDLAQEIAERLIIATIKRSV